MAQPTPYSRHYNFTNFQTVNPAASLPAAQVDLELNSVKATLDQILNNLKLLQRDDTAVANQSIGYDQLKAELNGFGFNPPTTWLTATNYVARATVFSGSGFYQCLVSHVSDDFTTDLEAGDWLLIADFSEVVAKDADLGTPTAVNLLNAQGFPLATAGAAAGVLPEAHGGIPQVSSVANLLLLSTSLNTTAFLQTINKHVRWNSADQSGTLLGPSITSTAVNSGTGVITSNGYGLQKYTAVVATSAVNGLALNTLYYLIVVDANNFKLASSLANAVAGTAVTLTGTTNFSIKQHNDPNQNIYITPAAAISGSSGAWVVQGGAWTGEHYITESPPANFVRLNDIVLIGEGATGWNGRQGSTGGFGSWLFGQGTGSTKAEYLLENAKMAVVTSGVVPSAQLPFPADAMYAILGASKNPLGVVNGSALGIAGFGVDDGNTAGSAFVWGGYFEGVRNANSSATITALEVEVTNASTFTTTKQTPYSTFAAGRTYGIFIGAGGGVGTNPTAQPASCALLITPNSATFETGINFNTTALEADSGVYHAVLLPEAHLIEWHEHTTDTIGFSIEGNVTDATHALSMVADNSGVRIFNSGGTLFNIPYLANAVDGLLIGAGTAASNTVTISPDGAGATLNFLVHPKASGSDLFLRDGLNNNVIVITDTSKLGFFNGSPAAKQAPTITTSTIADAVAKAAVNALITALNNSTFMNITAN